MWRWKSIVRRPLLCGTPVSYFSTQISTQIAPPQTIPEIAPRIKLTRKEQQRLYRLKNKEAIRLQKQAYCQKNSELIREKKRIYFTKHAQRIKEQKRKYIEDHKELLKEKQRNYTNNHRSHIKMKKRDYNERNRDWIRERNRAYRDVHREQIREKKRLYNIRNREAIRERKRIYYQKVKARRVRKNMEWQSPEKVRHFLEQAKCLLYVKQVQDWYRISRLQISKIGGASLYTVFGNLGKALLFAYPEVLWDLSKFSLRGKKSNQRWLRVMMELILPQETIVLEDFLHPDLLWDSTSTNFKMELDIWIPKLNLALEYQGEHHYHDLCTVYGPNGTAALYTKRDELKKQMCLSKGITLVTIPYWWDGKKESLAATLHQELPDLFTKTEDSPIPVLPPKNSKNDYKLKDNQIATFLMHGKEWNIDQQDPAGWIISEKLDGFRAFWDGSKLYSKSGQTFSVPLEFTRSFPNGVCLDGELWVGYNQFPKLSSILKRSNQIAHNSYDLWKDVRFCVFDAPLYPGHYLERHSYMTKLMDNHTSNPNIFVIPIVSCSGLDHLQSILEQIKQKTGEGVMLYDPKSEYTSGRTNHVLKVKTFSEEDVKFVGQNPNSYSFLCEQKNGSTCIVKCSGWDYMFPPAPGTVLSVRHSGIFNRSQKFKHPFLLRVRTDLNWNQILMEPLM